MYINQRKAYNWFYRNFLMKKTSQNWYAFDNPFDPDGFGKAKMAVHFKYQLVKCWRTGYRDYITQFVMDYEGVSYTGAMAILNEENEADIDLNFLDEVNISVSQRGPLELPYGFKSLVEGDGIIAQRARDYISSRGFDVEEMDMLGFGYCDERADDFKTDYFGYIIIPFKKRGSLNYYIGRDFIGNYLRYKNPAVSELGIKKGDLFYNEDALELRSKAYLMEGWSDAATMGKRGIASLGWSLSNEQKGKIIKSNLKRLVIVPDLGEENGESFYKKAVKLSLDFIDHKEVKVIDYRDYAHLGKDTNEIGKEITLKLEKETDLMTHGKAMEIIL